MRYLLTAVVLLGSAISSRAAVIDFETGSFSLSPGQTGSLEGYNFTVGGIGGAFIIAPITASGCSPACVSDGTRTMAMFNDADVTMAPAGGGVFSLLSFDVAGTFTSGSTRNITSIEVIGNLFGGGQVTQTFVTNPAAFQTLSLLATFTNLTSAQFIGLTPAGGSSPEFQLDNIGVNAAAVPEPSSIILLGTSVLLLGLFRRLTA